MLTTAFVSMWISNTATTAMMVPIAYAVIKELESARASRKQHGDEDNGDVTLTSLPRNADSDTLQSPTVDAVAYDNGKNVVELPPKYDVLMSNVTKVGR